MQTKLSFLKTSFFVLFCYSLLYSQETSSQAVFFDAQKVVPSSYAAVTGTNTFSGPFSNTEITYQFITAASELTDLVGKNLVSISFRNGFDVSTSWPASDAVFFNYDIYLSAAVNPVDRTLFFSQNAVGPITQVRSGNLVIPANALTTGANPNNFSFDINFSTPWFYSGGNLLVEIRHFGSLSPSRRVDSVNTSVSGYGTLFSACWYPSNTTSFNSAFEGNFSVVNFKAVDFLDTTNLEKATATVAPNPTTECIIIDSNSKILNIKLFNLVGQLMMNKAVNQKRSTLDLSQFSQGTYLLSIESEFGIETQKVIKK